ncbi:hypothetical protein DFH08DRAFT_941089 [Mycena albidolilacea]|uniref:Uncharacterized protein n=1 Tax=Mycena albidolilacea TaxID=1033008 RepID=A0AAD6ZKC2_9AGAR|nr:hypothetical protein DFH08DRAFT_941089 [Mycena albidolilacea]
MARLPAHLGVAFHGAPSQLSLTSSSTHVIIEASNKGYSIHPARTTPTPAPTAQSPPDALGTVLSASAATLAALKPALLVREGGKQPNQIPTVQCIRYAHLFSSTHASTSSARTVDGRVCGAPDPSKKILGTPRVVFYFRRAFAIKPSQGSELKKKTCLA